MQHPHHPSPFPRRRIAWFIAVSVVVTVSWLRVELVDRLGDQGHFAKYTTYAARIAAGDLPVERLGDLSPGYLWLLSTLTGPLGLDFNAVRSLQVTLGSLIALLAAAAAWRLAGGAAAITAALAVLGSRAVLVNATEAEPETLILLLNSAALAALLGGRGRGWRLASGLLFGLSAATRPTVLPAAALIALWLVVNELRTARSAGRPTLLRALPVGFVAGLVLPLLVLRLGYAAVPGAQTLMNPGTVFYEGSNPTTTGLAGDAPLVVKEVEPSFAQPDALHLAYREIAEAALPTVESRHASNTFWGTKARAFVAAHTGAWLRLELAKLHFALASPEAWDLATMVRKERQLAGLPWIPFGFLVVAAALALAAPGRARETTVVALYAAAYLVVLVSFYVTSRQRAPLVPALAILAGVGVQHGLHLWQRGERGKVAAAISLLIAGGATLGIPSHAHREDAHEWSRRFAYEATLKGIAAADSEVERDRWRGLAILLGDLPATPDTLVSLREAVAESLARPLSAAERFDTAAAAMRAADWSTAERLLEQLEGLRYHPERGALSTSSIAYHRARCALRLGRWEDADPLLERARADAPGDAMVLALSASVARMEGDEVLGLNATRELASLHDPFTARLAAARAAADCGDLARARQLLVALTEDLPQWPRPAILLESVEIAP